MSNEHKIFVFVYCIGAVKISKNRVPVSQENVRSLSSFLSLFFCLKKFHISTHLDDKFPNLYTNGTIIRTNSSSFKRRKANFRDHIVSQAYRS